MKKIYLISSLVAGLMAALPAMAFPLERPAVALGFLGFGLGMMAFMWLVCIAALVFWIMMLVHAATHEIKDKVVWVLILIFAGIIGALIYYFVVKRNFHE